MAKLGDLTVDLLEKNPEKYGQALGIISVREDSEEVKKKLNEKPYETWHSNHLFSLSRLVGKLNPEAQDRENYGVDTFYGSRNVEGIPTDVAINLLKMMMNAGGDITEKDYYGKNILEYLQGGDVTLFYRTGNEEYTKFVEEIFSREENTGPCEEGIPPEKGPIEDQDKEKEVIEEGFPPEKGPLEDQDKGKEVIEEGVPMDTDPPISRYYQKQFERFIKNTEKKEDIQEAFYESIPGEKYEDDTLYTRLKRNPRRCEK